MAWKAQRTWRRIPPAQRRRMLESAGRQARVYGPVVARQIGTAVRNARKPPPA